MKAVEMINCKLDQVDRGDNKSFEIDFHTEANSNVKQTKTQSKKKGIANRL